MKKVLVLFGGVSSEHEVSLVSARSVIQNIPRDRYEVLTLGITKQGEWLLYEGDPEALPEDNWARMRQADARCALAGRLSSRPAHF